MNKKMKNSILLLGIMLLFLLRPVHSYAFEALNQFTNESLTFTIRASDRMSGIRSIETPDGNMYYFGDFTEGEEEVFIDYQVHTNGTYTFTASDVATNQVSTTQTINNIDKTSPSVAVNGNIEHWINEDVRLTLQFEDNGSGLSEIHYPDGSVEYLGAVDKGVTEPVIRDYTVKQNGSYTFEAIDLVGNRTAITEQVIFIDKLSPSQTHIQIELK